MSFSVMGDVHHAMRMVARAPGFALVAVLTFAVGIGMNTAVFNVVNGVLLEPLPYPESERVSLLWLDNRRQGIREDVTSYPAYLDWKSQSTSYDFMAAFTPAAFSLTQSGEPERLSGAQVTATFFDVMQLPPVVGRVFAEDNEVPGQDAVVVISHGLWQRRFGGASDILGKTINLNGRPREVVAVMSPSLQWPVDAELWTPLAATPQQRADRNWFWLPVIGRLKPGVSVTQAQTEMNGIGDRLEQAYPETKGFGVYVVSLQQQLSGRIERPLLVLLSAVGFVLLIGCANLANLLIGRAAARAKEFAVRTALGASRVRVVRQIVTETFVLAILGGVAGLVIAHWATQFFVTIGGASIPRKDAIGIDGVVVSFALLATTTSALLAGVLPALRASSGNPIQQLRQGGGDGHNSGSPRTRGVLVAAEVSLSLILLAGAGLLIQTLWTIQQAERGFSAERVAMMTVSPPATTYRNAAAVIGVYDRLLEGVRSLPGVESAASGTGLLQPLIANSTTFSIEGQPLPSEEDRIEYPVEVVSPGYFETLGMTFLHGRGFAESDDAKAPRAAVVNERLMRMVWPGLDPIGRRLWPGDDTSQAPWLTVIGVIRDAHRSDVTRPIRPEVYLSTRQSATRTQTLFVKTAGDPSAIVPAIREVLRQIDPELPLFRVTSLDRELALTMSQPRFQAFLLAAFAGIAVLLAAIGIYGVTANAVRQRTQEVGIRIAMGAARHDVLPLMMVQHLGPALVGVAIGLVGAAILSRSVESLLFGVDAIDPATFILVALVLLGVATAACLIPALRAAQVDPVVALRGEH